MYPNSLRKVPNQIRIDDVTARCSCDFEACQIWDLTDWPSDKKNLFARKVGQLALFPRVVERYKMWVVVNVWLLHHRGEGVMRRLITELRPRYPFMCSCVDGHTSPDACRMFEALGAEKLITKECPKGFVYFLRPLLLTLADPGPHEGVEPVA